MFNGLNGALIGAGLGALVAFGVGLKFGSDGEARKCDAKVVEVKRVAAEQLDGLLQEKFTLQAEVAQAKGEVEKVNATTIRQFEELQALLSADQAKRDEAAIKVEKAATDAARNAREAATRAQAAREVIQNVADKCAASGADPEFVRMLNGILAPAP